MLESGYIRLYRSFLTWEWYSDSATKDVFLHLILTANWEPKKWKGITVKRGQRVYSRASLAKEMRLSERNIRTAINHLISTGEVTNQTTPQYSIITIKNYDLYQQPTSEVTSDRPASDQPPTSDRPQLKKDKESKNDKKAIKRERIAFSPPTLDDVIAYCRERSSPVDPKKFFDYFDTGGWVDSKGNHVKNWKQKIITWEGREKNPTSDSANIHIGETKKSKGTICEKGYEDQMRKYIQKLKGGANEH
ncbi:hypothetical protein [Oscillibacter sp.]|uniref:hypothetical protein n=1 Tax=Oscillibacter sp. TaxID=1945593 RepID=UPI00289BA320|nr:hypothetical protein [Oscillibacter sp.]